MSDNNKIKAIYGLSAMQKSMLLNYAIDETTDAYVEQFDFTLTGRLNTDYMYQALVKVTEHFDILRTVFSYRNTDEPYQIVLKELKPPFQVLDFSNESDVKGCVEKFKEEDRKKGFQLSKESPLRGCVIKEDDVNWRFIFTFHHIIMDGWSLGPLFEMLTRYYEELISKGACLSQHEKYSYKSYISWLEKQDRLQAKQYWYDYLQDYENEVGIPKFSITEEYRNATYSFTLSNELRKKISGFAKEKCITENVVFQVVWGILLGKINYTEDVVFGSVVSGRTTQLSGTDKMVGLFVNTQPVRIQFESTSKFEEICKNVQNQNFQSMPYEYYPLYDIQSNTILKNKLLDHVVAFENYPLAEQLQNFNSEDDNGLKFTGVDVFERTNYDFHIVVNPGSDFKVTFTYNELQYSDEFIRMLENAIVKILEDCMDDNNIVIGNICICSQEEKEKILQTYQMPVDITYPSDKTLIQLFKNAVERYEDKIAIRWKDKAYTYKEIDQWSDSFALKLKEYGIQEGTAIGLLVGHTPEMVIGMLAILKNNNYYVPIDVKDSNERIRIILDDANTKYVCTTNSFVEKLSDKNERILIDSYDMANMTDEYVMLEDEKQDTSKKIAYMMYTSGSTGKPKGCHITHRNIVRLVFEQNYYEFDEHKVLLQTGSPAFDACTFEVWGTILHGAELVLVDEIDILDGQRLEDTIKKKKITSIWLTASLFNQLCDNNPKIFSELRFLLVGGSALSPKHIAKVKNACPNVNIINGYGPTENTTFSTTHAISDEDLLLERIPIGKPIHHSTAFVLDKDRNLLPIGCIGELCVGGDGVGLGYYNRPEMTNERFIDIPQLADGKLYRTGDLVRWLPNGFLDYIRREDSQVKINGFRVEISEIETALNTIEDIKDATVIVKEIGNDKKLYAFYVAEEEIAVDKIKSKLSEIISNYMIPSSFTRVEELPLNKNGKVDKEKLNQIQANKEEAICIQMDNLSEIEKLIYRIVAELLGTEQIDIYGNFFEIGITSLNLITINNRLRKELDKDIPLTVLFQYTSIVSLAEYIEHMDMEESEEEELYEEEEEDNEENVSLLRNLMDDAE